MDDATDAWIGRRVKVILDSSGFVSLAGELTDIGERYITLSTKKRGPVLIPHTSVVWIEEVVESRKPKGGGGGYFGWGRSRAGDGFE